MRWNDILISGHVYLVVFEKISPASIIFESKDTILFDIPATIERTQLELKALEETACIEDEFDNPIRANENKI